MAEFWTKHEAEALKKKGITEGFYKDCLHLCIINEGAPPPPSGRGGLYSVGCKESSLDLGSESCPAECLLFKDRLATEKAERVQKRWQAFWTASTEPFRYFAKLPPLTQALLIFLGIALFSRRLAESIVSIIKALK